MSYKEFIAKVLKGRSVNKAAKDLGLQQRSLDRYSKGETLPDYDTALAMAHEAGIDEREAFRTLATAAAPLKKQRGFVQTDPLVMLTIGIGLGTICIM